MPQFGSKMKYHTIATAAPDSTVGVKMTVRAPLRKRSSWFSSSASARPEHQRQADRADGEDGRVQRDLPEAGAGEDA